MAPTATPPCASSAACSSGVGLSLAASPMRMVIASRRLPKPDASVTEMTSFTLSRATEITLPLVVINRMRLASKGATTGS